MAKIITRINGRKFVAGSTAELVEKMRGYTPEIDFGEYIPMYDDDIPTAVTAAVCDIEDEIRLWEVQ